MVSIAKRRALDRSGSWPTTLAQPGNVSATDTQVTKADVDDVINGFESLLAEHSALAIA
jgi:hypothetical protein